MSQTAIVPAIASAVVSFPISNEHYQLPAPVDTAEHYEFMVRDLAKSGLTPADIGAFPVAGLGNAFTGQAAGYCIPYGSHATPGMHRCRYDRAVDKYLAPPGSSAELYVPASADYAEWAQADDLWIVEGEKKAACFSKYFGIPCVGIAGVSMYGTKVPYKNRYSDNPEDNFRVDLIRPLHAAMARGKRVHLVVDGDLRTNRDIQHAVSRLGLICRHLYGVEVTVYLPPHQKGVDDWIMADDEASIEGLQALPYSTLHPTVKDLIAYMPHLDLKLSKDGYFLLKNTAYNLEVLMTEFFRTALSFDYSYGYVFNGRVYKSQEALMLLAYKALEKVCPNGELHFSDGMINKVLVGLLKDEAYYTNVVGERVKLLSDGMTSTQKLRSFVGEWLCESPTELEIECGRLLMCSIAARLMQPGCQVDLMVILHGKQGCGKSTFIEALGKFDFGLGFGKNFCFTTSLQEMMDMQTAKSVEADSAYCKILNLDDLPRLQGFSQTRLKNRISKKTVRVDVKYEKVLEVPTPYVIVGSTNYRNILADVSGNRRYYMLHVTKASTHRPSQAEVEELLLEAAAYVQAHPNDWWDLPPHLRDAKKFDDEDHMDAFSTEALVTDFIRDFDWPVLTRKQSRVVAGQGVALAGSKYTAVVPQHLLAVLEMQFKGAEFSAAKRALAAVLEKLGYSSKTKISVSNVDWKGLQIEQFCVVSQSRQVWAFVAPIPDDNTGVQ